MKSTISVYLIASGVFGFTIFASARNQPLAMTAAESYAAAYVRVVGVSEELRGELIYKSARLQVLYGSLGLDGITHIETPFGVPSRVGHLAFSHDSPYFLAGDYVIVLLNKDKSGLVVRRALRFSQDERLDEHLGEDDLGITANMGVCEVMDALEKVIPFGADSKGSSAINKIGRWHADQRAHGVTRDKSAATPPATNAPATRPAESPVTSAPPPPPAATNVPPTDPPPTKPPSSK